MALFRKLLLDATPAQVWDAVATGPGWSSWYAPSELEPREGGIGRTDFGGGTYSGSGLTNVASVVSIAAYQANHPNEAGGLSGTLPAGAQIPSPGT